jgi:hypothetical protein
MATKNQPKRGDVVLFSVDVLSGPNEKGQYVLEFYDDSLRHGVEFTSTLPNDAQIFPRDEDPDEIYDERDRRGDCILFPFTVVDGLDHRGFYDVIVHDEERAEILRLMTHPPKRAGLIRLTTDGLEDAQIIDHVEVSDEISGASSQEEQMPSSNTYGDIDYNDPSTFTVKHLPSPDAWPSNGPAWLFDGSTPEEIAAMQQMAIDDAHQLDMGIEPVSRFPPLERP